MATGRVRHSEALRSVCTAAAWGVALATSACTLISKPDVEQCDEDQDCARFGENLTCERHVCERPHDAGDGGADGGDASLPDAGLVEDAGEPTCTVASDCPGSEPQVFTRP